MLEVSLLLYFVFKWLQVGALEPMNMYLTGDDTEFSEQYFVDCTFTRSGCEGGMPNIAFKLTTERQYLKSLENWPYTGECKCMHLYSREASIFANRFK